MSRDFLNSVDRTKGKFRSLLLASLTNYVNNRRDWEGRVKRGGKVRHVPLDFRDAEGRYVGETPHEATPEKLFDRRWALTVLNRVLEDLERELAGAGKGELLERLKSTMIGGLDSATYAEIGAELGMTEPAVRQEAYRIRKRYRWLVRKEVGRTVAEPDQVDLEIAELFSALRH